ncbi:MAG TPA: hypothetical protein VIG74_00950, partial [Alphaproteobacteria bacterium]
ADGKSGCPLPDEEGGVVMGGEYTAMWHETAETLSNLAKEAGVSVAEIKRMIMEEHERISRCTVVKPKETAPEKLADNSFPSPYP